MRTESRSNRLLDVLLTLSVVALPTLAGAQNPTASGAYAYGNARWGYYSCATLNCAVASGELSNTEVGGNGFTTATTSFFGNNLNYPGSAYEHYFASANFNGALGLAELKASAQSREVPGTNGVSPNTVCCYNYTAAAIANTVQWYAFSGTSAQTYRIEFTVDAIMQAYQDLPEYLALASVGASIFALDGAPNADGPLGNGLGGSFVAFDGNERDAFNRVTRTGFFDLTVNPGAGFFLSSTLSANGFFSPFSSADASNTMNVRFTSGNVALLTATIPGAVNTTVPEPSTYLLMSVGLAALAIASRRRATRLG